MYRRVLTMIQRKIKRGFGGSEVKVFVSGTHSSSTDDDDESCVDFLIFDFDFCEVLLWRRGLYCCARPCRSAEISGAFMHKM